MARDFVVLFVNLVILTTNAANKGNNSNGLGKDVPRDIVSVKQTIDEGLAHIASAKCAHVKKIIRAENVAEPDLNHLTLDYINNDTRISYKLGSAAEEIPADRRYDPHRKLIIFVHGFGTNPSESSFRNISTALIKSGEHNVLALDSSSLFDWLYVRASIFVRHIGEKLGQMLANMIDSGLQMEQIHLIGHSLGAHVAGFAGKTVKKRTGRRLPRISGLDPAGPCFSDVESGLRLEKTDAEFVDVIHTNAGVFGLQGPLGHVDFYPNGGTEQPNCFLQQCSHSRSWLYYAQSILKPESFPAKRCKNWGAFKKGNCDGSVRYMGYPCEPGARGLYFLRTGGGGGGPYGLGEAGLVYENNDSILKNISHIIKTS